MRQVGLLFVILPLMISLIIPLKARAEYRAFHLVFKTKDGEITKELDYNLDPEQYVAFFPLPKDLFLSYTSTWMCPGRTNGEPICLDPKGLQQDSSSDQNPISP